MDNPTGKKGPLILIIDDDNWIHRVLKKHLNEMGFEVVSALTPVDGMAYAIRYKPDLIILDIIMPEVKGDILLKMMKKVHLTKDIPIIITSGNLNWQVLRDTYHEGSVAYLSKPFTQETLVMKIKETLPTNLLLEMQKTSPILAEKKIFDSNVNKE